MPRDSTTNLMLHKKQSKAKHNRRERESETHTHTQANSIVYITERSNQQGVIQKMELKK